MESQKLGDEFEDLVLIPIHHEKEITTENIIIEPPHVLSSPVTKIKPPKVVRNKETLPSPPQKRRKSQRLIKKRKLY